MLRNVPPPPKLSLIDTCRPQAIDIIYHDQVALVEMLELLPKKTRQEYITKRLLETAAIYEKQLATWRYGDDELESYGKPDIRYEPIPDEVAQEDEEYFDKVLSWVLDYCKAEEMFKFCKEQYDLISNNKEPKQLKEYTFKELFVDEEKCDYILSLPCIKENVSDTGAWLTEPKGLFMVALCNVLENRGYLKSAPSNPQRAMAFYKQFQILYSDKIFQPNERFKAINQEEFFKSIPKLN